MMSFFNLTLWVYLCKCGAAGSASARTACAIRPTLRQSQSPPQPRKSSPPWCPSPPLLPVWMNVYFLFPWCWSPLLFDSLSVLVVRGGAVCLPTSPSWFLFWWDLYNFLYMNNFRLFWTGHVICKDNLPSPFLI